MTEAIGNARIQKSITFKDGTFDDDARRLGKALLRLNGFGETDRWGSGTMRVWSIHSIYGVLAIAIGSCESDALDNAMDNDCLRAITLDADDTEDAHHCGNAGELVDLTHVHIKCLSND